MCLLARPIHLSPPSVPLLLPLPHIWFPHCKWSTGQKHHRTKLSHTTQTNSETDLWTVQFKSPPATAFVNPPKATMEVISFSFSLWVGFLSFIRWCSAAAVKLHGMLLMFMVLYRPPSSFLWDWWPVRNCARLKTLSSLTLPSGFHVYNKKQY